MKTFQRIQRNRQSRIRVKLSRRAGKRPDEILEEDIENTSICSPGSIAGHSVGQSGSSMHHMQRYPVSSSGSLTNSHQPRSTSTPGMLNHTQLSQLVFQPCILKSFCTVFFDI